MKRNKPDDTEQEPIRTLIYDFENLRSIVDRLAGPLPGPVVNLAREGDEGWRHTPFLACCNYLHAPRLVELFRYSYFKEMSDLLGSLLDILSEERHDLVFFCFSIRRLLELIAYLCRSVGEVEKTAERLKHFQGIAPSLITDPPTRPDIRIFDEVCSSLNRIRMPTTLDWSILHSGDMSKSVERQANRAESIMKSLKALDNRVPATHAIYSICSEFVHPNSMVSLRTWGGALGPVPDHKQWITINSEELNSQWFSYACLLLHQRFSEFAIGARRTLSEDWTMLKRIEKDLMKICRPIARAGFKKYVDSSDTEFDGLGCPCGSKRTFRKCCGRS